MGHEFHTRWGINPLMSRRCDVPKPQGGAAYQPRVQPWVGNRGEPVNRETGKPENRKTGKPANRRTGEPANRRTGKPENRKTGENGESPCVLKERRTGRTRMDGAAVFQNAGVFLFFLGMLSFPGVAPPGTLAFPIAVALSGRFALSRALPFAGMRCPVGARIPSPVSEPAMSQSPKGAWHTSPGCNPGNLRGGRHLERRKFNETRGFA